MKKIFITGASGCIGHYIVESLLQDTNHYLYLLVRNTDKLQFEWENNPRIEVLSGNLKDIEEYSDLLLKEINIAILAATSWGGTAESYDINVVKTLALIDMLNPKICEQILYFSTASILDRNNNLLLPASEFGTDYIRTKYQCFSQLLRSKLSDRIVALFPTLVFGGDSNKPVSHLSSGLPEIVKWLNLIRWIKTDGSFHFVHGRDIAIVVTYLVEHPNTVIEEEPDDDNYQELPSIKRVVLGNEAITVNETIAQICGYFGKKVYFGIPLYPWLTNFLIKVFRIQMDSWSYFSLKYRHFTYKNPITPANFGLTNYVNTIKDIMKTSGF
ncbi:NAD dependent epimerase/dehydratase family protein [Hyella patelloides LEGE 07179]|uniref:NAD dependent epimerase/dehydratase family protein n=1 Tax=Hyella patelloides LEGE 07179 TaxID=945734 RepID=A0A563VPV8_9CYAN|nr:NAD(P)-dependent oxidoreductase [Hyella patelloides]VEP13441.1 NAD dependent epimerase/dehydratase family protein [Hyella patelloides LEGE 07179]